MRLHAKIMNITKYLWKECNDFYVLEGEISKRCIQSIDKKMYFLSQIMYNYVGASNP